MEGPPDKGSLPRLVDRRTSIRTEVRVGSRMTTVGRTTSGVPVSGWVPRPTDSWVDYDDHRRPGRVSRGTPRPVGPLLSPETTRGRVGQNDSSSVTTRGVVSPAPSRPLPTSLYSSRLRSKTPPVGTRGGHGSSRPSRRGPEPGPPTSISTVAVRGSGRPWFQSATPSFWGDTPEVG